MWSRKQARHVISRTALFYSPGIFYFKCDVCPASTSLGATSPWQQSTVMNGLFILRCAWLTPPPPTGKHSRLVRTICKRKFSSEYRSFAACPISAQLIVISPPNKFTFHSWAEKWMCLLIEVLLHKTTQVLFNVCCHRCVRGLILDFVYFLPLCRYWWYKKKIGFCFRFVNFFEDVF